MAFKSPRDIAEAACTAGCAKIQSPKSKLIVLAFLAGAFIAFGSQLAVTTAAGSPWPATIPGIQKLIFASVFPVGLMLVVIAGSELFTGNCMVPFISCLEGKARWIGLFRNWFLVYIGNFIGALFVAFFLAHLTGLLANDPWNTYIGNIAVAKTSLSWGAAFWRAVGCNWLVCLAVWMAISADDIGGKILAIWFPIMAFVALGFEHSVANMFFLPAAIFTTGKITWAAMIVNNLIPVTLGNILGGSFFVGTIYWWLYQRKKDSGAQCSTVTK
ncbi:MAG: formate/nitrite transporter family protein [Dehalococcoidales bacterium]|nr:formate/nitrite transporter family protein [Dehalococcoidales bacterium]